MLWYIMCMLHTGVTNDCFVVNAHPLAHSFITSVLHFCTQPPITLSHCQMVLTQPGSTVSYTARVTLSHTSRSCSHTFSIVFAPTLFSNNLPTTNQLTGDLLESEQTVSVGLRKEVSELERKVDQLQDNNNSLEKQVGEGERG